MGHYDSCYEADEEYRWRQTCEGNLKKYKSPHGRAEIEKHVKKDLKKAREIQDLLNLLCAVNANSDYFEMEVNNRLVGELQYWEKELKKVSL